MKIFHDQSLGKYGAHPRIERVTPGSTKGLATDCATGPGAADLDLHVFQNKTYQDISWFSMVRVNADNSWERHYLGEL